MHLTRAIHEGAGATDGIAQGRLQLADEKLAIRRIENLQLAENGVYNRCMKNSLFYPRYLQPRIIEALADSPVVLIHGPRQCGKTTLARRIGELEGFTYVSFDDDTQCAAAQADPVGYIADLPQRVILDEVQRVTEIFTSLKRAVDARRQPGRFILTGSANVLLVPKLADSLAGRMEILRLHPLS